jgi:putative aldouronate transport system substrate-binding protein
MKKTVAATLCLAMLLTLLAGCGSTTTTTTTESEETATTVESTAPAEEATTTDTASDASEAPAAVEAPAADAVEAQPAKEEDTPVPERVDYTLPLFDDTLEFSWFWVNNGASDTKEKQNIQFWNELQDQLNVSITWIQPGSAVAAEQYNLMIISGEWADLIWHNGAAADGYSTAYPGGYDVAIDDDIYLALNDLIPEYAPNYYYYLMTNEDVLKAVTTDEGNWYAFHQIEDAPQGITSGTYIREDLLEATGMEMPTTTDGWMDLLAALKANGVKSPLHVDNDGGASLIGNAFGTTMSWSFKVDTDTDEVIFDPVSDEFRSYIEWIAEAYANGYISDSFTSDDVMDGARSKLLNGECATYSSMWSFDSVAERNMGVTLTACSVVTTPDNDQPMLYDAESLTARVTNLKECAITAKTENPEALVKFLDFFYSDTGSRIANYGFTEGESYTYVDGEIQLLPEMIEVDREVGLTNIAKYAFEEGPFYEISNRRVIVENEKSQNNIKVWSDIDTDAVRYMSMPTLSFTVDESNQISSVAADLATAVEGQMLKWMTGAEPLNDDTWNAYVSYLEGIGMDQYLDAYASAYARYENR